MSVVAAWDLRVPSSSSSSKGGSSTSTTPSSSSAAAVPSPRSLCVVNPLDFQPPSTNPFENASALAAAEGSGGLNAVAAAAALAALPSGIVYGTNAGTMHYRSYAPSSQNLGGLPGQPSSQWKGSGDAGASGSSHQQHQQNQHQLQLPLGVATPTSRPSPQLPRWYYPVDALLKHQQSHQHQPQPSMTIGSIVACHPLRDVVVPPGLGGRAVQFFLVLADDAHDAHLADHAMLAASPPPPPSAAANTSSPNPTAADTGERGVGSSSSSIEGYAAHVVSVLSGSIQIVSSHAHHPPLTSLLPLPRMGCACVVMAADGGGGGGNGVVYYASGRTIGRLTARDLDQYTNTILHGSKHQQQQHSHHSMSSRLGLQGRQRPHETVATAAPPPHLAAAGRGLVRHASAAGLPSPGVRNGPHALCVSTIRPSGVHVAVVAVGNAFYAINLTACLITPTSNNSSSTSNNNTAPPASSVASVTTKILTLQGPSYSQVHPAICVDVRDPTTDEDWAGGVLVANGRECALVDLYVTPDDVLLMEAVASPRAPTTGGGKSASAPIAKLRGAGGGMMPSSSSSSLSSPSAAAPARGVTVTASPILACAASWPWVALLTSEGLVTIRSPGCLSVPIRQVEVGRPNDYFELQWLHPPPRQSVLNQHRDFLPSSTMSSTSSSSSSSLSHHHPCSLVAISFSGEGKVLAVAGDTPQDHADRLVRLCIDALGANGFPRAEVAQAVNASFTATSHVGIVTTENSSTLLRARSALLQYLEAALNLTDFASGASPGWPVERSSNASSSQQQPYLGGFTELEESSVQQHRRRRFSGRSVSAPGYTSHQRLPSVVDETSPPVLLTCTALLCLVSMQVSPPQSGLANRAAKSCSEKLGVVLLNDDGAPGEKRDGTGGDTSTFSSPMQAGARACELVVERLLRDASSFVSLLSGSSLTSSQPILARGQRASQAALHTEFVESCVWLLRACGKHERAMEVAYERLQRQSSVPSDSSSGTSGSSSSTTRSGWSTIKYESYTATHLSELWASGSEAACRLVLQSSATHRLLQNNPRLGLSVFCSAHPQNEAQWRAARAYDDPILSNPSRAKQVLQLLKSIHPSIPYAGNERTGVAASDGSLDRQALPLDSGRAMSIFFLESAIGVSTGRPSESDEFDSLPPDHDLEERVADLHDELALLLLEGVIALRRDDVTGDHDTELGSLYRRKLRRFLQWPLAKIRSDNFTSALPPSFLHEKALLFGRSGRHEDALRILYRDLNSLDLALEYCDARHEQLKAHEARLRSRMQQHQDGMFDDYERFDSIIEGGDNAYLPLVRVALDSDDAERGTAAAIQVLALRRSAIDRAAALRLLPSDVPVSAVARPFLIPALVDSESQVRRLTVVSSLLRARYLRLKDQLTTAQLKAQSNLYVVPQLRNLQLGDPLHSTNPFRARTSSQASSAMPDVSIVKHFFPRHLVIQAKVTNSVGLNAKYARTLSDVAFVVAESSEEAIQPLMQVPIQVLPPKMTGCAWCVLSAAPARMEGPTAQLTCELRYTVQSVDVSSGMAMPIVPGVVSGRTYVEELQDLEVYSSHFS